MDFIEDWSGGGGKKPDKKFGEWDFKGFFERPDETISETNRLIESFRTIINHQEKPKTELPKKEKKTGLKQLYQYRQDAWENVLSA